MSTLNINVSKADMGLDQVDNTSDADKPISTATQTALDLKQSTSGKSQANGYVEIDANEVALIGSSVPVGTIATPMFINAKIEDPTARTHLALVGTNTVDGISGSVAGYDRVNGSVGVANKRIWQLEQSVVTGVNAGNQLRIATFVNTSGVTNGGLIFRDNGNIHLDLGNFTANNLSGTNTGDQDLSGLAPYTTATTGSVISFVVPQVYNTFGTPSTSDLTDNTTGAKIGVVQKIYHNKAVEPTYPAGWVKMGTGTYTAGVLNVIFAEWVSGTRVEYWITKPA